MNNCAHLYTHFEGKDSICLYCGHVLYGFKKPLGNPEDEKREARIDAARRQQSRAVAS